jgi:hypothetical protein
MFTTAFILALGYTQPPIRWVLGVLSHEQKRPGREARHSPPSGAEIKNSSYTSTFPTRLLCVVLGLNTESVSMAWCLVKPRDNLT